MELYIAGQLRRTNRLAAQRPCPAYSPASSSPVPRIRPGGRDSSYRLARSSLPTGTNPLIAAVRCGGTPVLSILRAISSRSDMDRSRVLSPTTRAARRNKVCSSTNSGSAQSKPRNTEYACSTRSGETTVSGPAWSGARLSRSASTRCPRGPSGTLARTPTRRWFQRYRRIVNTTWNRHVWSEHGATVGGR